MSFRRDRPIGTSAGNVIGVNIVDAKGDLIVGTADNAIARLPVGANGFVALADSAAATGLVYRQTANITTMAAGSYYLGQATTIDSTAGIGNNTEYASRFIMGSSPQNKIDRIGITITVAGDVGSTIRLGIRNSVDSRPNSLIADFGAVPADAIAYAELVIDQALTPGTTYWLCCAPRNSPIAAPVVRTRQIDNTLPLAAGNSGNISALFQASAGATLDAAWVGIQGTETGPRIAVRAL